MSMSDRRKAAAAVNAIGADADQIVVPPIVHEVLISPGRPLDSATRAFMEPRFGHDFSKVRVHSDGEAEKSAKAMNALAYTVGHHIVFGSSQYAPSSSAGRRLLSHELAHVMQQRGRSVLPGQPVPTAEFGDTLEQAADHAADDIAASHFDAVPSSSAIGAQKRSVAASLGTVGGAMIQRQKGGEAKEKKTRPKGKAQAPAINWTFGEVNFVKRARDALLKGSGLFRGADNGHVAVRDDGRLGYDPDYKDPTDPFRWEKLKYIVDSGKKVDVDKVSLVDSFKVLIIDKDKQEEKSLTLREAGAAGLTLPTAAMRRATQPTGILVASPAADTCNVYFSTEMGGAESSSLAHELFGHLYLSLKGVLWQHPKKPEDIKARGTLEEKHGIKDPLGGVYKGTVKDYIDLYVGSESFSALKSPTQFVSRDQLRSALNGLKKDFSTQAKGSMNEAWEVPDSLGLAWEAISANYAVAETADPKVQTSIEEELATWYGTLSADQQYVFMSYLTDVRFEILRRTKLASRLLGKIKPPAGMRSREP